jgi:V8-like Glu-specific endopeptidase
MLKFLIGFFTFTVSLPYAHALIIGGVEMSGRDPIAKSTTAIFEPSGNGPGGALCTASLISKNTAVTAAHCLQPGGYAPVMLFGSDIHSPKTAQRPVVGSVVNPLWGKNKGRGMDQGDIAVVKFGGKLPKGYEPASLDSGADRIQKGETAILAGYGVSNARTHSGAGILRKTAVRVANGRAGKSEMIFDQSHGRGACHGDSGGPAYLERGGKMILAGVTNRSYPSRAADDCGHKVVYTKVAPYRSWIKKSEEDLHGQNEFTPRLMKGRIKRGVKKPSSHAPIRKNRLVRRRGYGRAQGHVPKPKIHRAPRLRKSHRVV